MAVISALRCWSMVCKTASAADYLAVRTKLTRSLFGGTRGGDEAHIEGDLVARRGSKASSQISLSRTRPTASM
jgi:hypothetical protein